MSLSPNDGSRPSRFLLDRYSAGELDADEAATVEASFDAQSRLHLAAVAAARDGLPVIDVAELRRRAIRSDVAEAQPLPAAANDTKGFRWIGPLGLALGAAVATFLVLARPTEAPDILYRGSDLLSVYEVHGVERDAYVPGHALGEGDVVGFAVDATGHQTVVLVSVDGDGHLSALFPEDVRDPPYPLAGQGLVPLSDLVTLDGAPGPEVFVALFDRPTVRATSEVEAAFRNGGHAGLVRWADATAGVDAVEVTRR
jgi:hypothetical protein